MIIIIHDLQERVWRELGIRLHEKDIVIGEGQKADLNNTIGNCAGLVIISRCVYGGFSPFIQRALESCRTHFSPLLELRHGQTHYKVKGVNKNSFGMVCCFYGNNITQGEERSARIQAVLDGISLQARGVKIIFCDSVEKYKSFDCVYEEK